MKTIIALTGASITAIAVIPCLANAAAATKTLPTAAPTTPAAPAIEHGAPVTGICLFSEAQAQAESLYGKGIDAQMKVLADAVNAELSAAQTKNKQAADALQAKQATTPVQEYTLAMAKINFQTADLQTLVAQRQEEIDQTEQEQYTLFATAMETAAIDAYQKNKCSLLLDRSAVMIGNQAMDITKAVISTLDSARPSVTFARKNLPPPAPLTAAQAAQAAAAQAAQRQ